MKKIILRILKFYKKFLSPDTGWLKKIGLTKGNVCTFYPTCSQYTIEAIEKYGVVKGLFKGIRRILRCHPWQKKHIDLLK